MTAYEGSVGRGDPASALRTSSGDETDQPGARGEQLSTPVLQYWLVTAVTDGVYTPFQGFGIDVTDRAFATLIEVLAALPASVAEIFVEPSALPRLRRPLTRKVSAIVGVPTFRAAQAVYTGEGAIQIILGLPEVIATIRPVVRSETSIFVSTLASDGVVGLDEHEGSWAQLLDAPIRNLLADMLPDRARYALLQTPLRANFPTGTLPSRAAGVTAPNESVATSLGYVYSGVDPIDAGQDGVYEDAILRSAEHALSLIGEDSANTVLYAPSIVRHLYAFGDAFWNNIFRRIRSQVIREVIKDGVFRNKGYSGFRMEIEGDLPEDNPYDDPVAGPVLACRQTELLLTAMGVAALASNNMEPALRLPNAVNFHAAELREVEKHANRPGARGKRLLQTSYKNLARNLGDEVSVLLMNYIRDKVDGITLVVDAPIEWMRIDGVPLMIRHEVSRISMTPGNLMLTQCIHSGVVTLPADALLDVLVIRSFLESDRIRNTLEHAVGLFDLERVRVTFADVSRSAELIERLNEFKGAVVVFDCHGGHDGSDGHGWIKIGAEKVDTWQLAHVARIPPIVILSACSTFALAGSHASVGNGLIRSGAMTVIGTLLPVSALNSATFVARLLYRIDAFLPALRSLNKNFITWRTLVSTFFRMSYSTDVLRLFIETKNWIPDSAFQEIGVQANYDINSLLPDWHERLIRRIADSAQRTVEDVMAVLESEEPLQETMFYCQIGRPEAIGIYIADSGFDEVGVA